MRLHAAVRAAVAEGEDVMELEAAGNTPLHSAAYEGWLEGAELLIDLGAKVNASNNAGDRPWHWAHNLGHNAMLDLLEKARCSLRKTGAGLQSSLSELYTESGHLGSCGLCLRLALALGAQHSHNAMLDLLEKAPRSPGNSGAGLQNALSELYIESGHLGSCGLCLRPALALGAQRGHTAMLEPPGNRSLHTWHISSQLDVPSQRGSFQTRGACTCAAHDARPWPRRMHNEDAWACQ